MWGNDENLGFLSHVGWLAEQSAEMRAECLAQGRIVTFRRGEAIYREGDDGFGLYGLISGSISVFIGHPRVAPRIATIVGPGTWFGVGPVLTGRRRNMECRAACDCMLLKVPGPVVEHLASASASNALALGALAMIGQDLAIRVSSELLIPSSNRRIAAIILRIASPDNGESRVSSEGVLVTQSQLAEMANVSRNVANGVLCRLRDWGWIETSYGRIAVRDRAALAAYAYGED